MIGVRGFPPTWNEIGSPSVSTTSIDTNTSASYEDDDSVRWAAICPTSSTSAIERRREERDPRPWSGPGRRRRRWHVASSPGGSYRAAPVEASRCSYQLLRAGRRPSGRLAPGELAVPGEERVADTRSVGRVPPPSSFSHRSKKATRSSRHHSKKNG